MRLPTCLFEQRSDFLLLNTVFSLNSTLNARMILEVPSYSVKCLTDQERFRLVAGFRVTGSACETEVVLVSLQSEVSVENILHSLPLV
jgi:hypothetical protein